MAELLPIKFFSKREEDKQRVEGNSPRELPKWVLSDDELLARSQHLTAGMDAVVSQTVWENRTVPVILCATLTKDAHAKSHRRKIESVFATKQNNINPMLRINLCYCLSQTYLLRVVKAAI